MQDALLGAIALGVLVMAAIQVGAVLFAARLARRIEALVGRVEQDLQPVIERLQAMSADAARAAGLAATQVERLDQTLTTLGARVDAAVVKLQQRVRRPAREGAAIVAGLRVGLLTLRELRRQQRSGPLSDDEDPLFIG